MKFINILVILTLVVLISCVDKKRHRSRKSNSYKSHLSSNNGTAIYGNLTNATSLKEKYLDMRNNTHTPLDTWGMYSGLKKLIILYYLLKFKISFNLCYINKKEQLIKTA